MYKLLIKTCIFLMLIISSKGKSELGPQKFNSQPTLTGNITPPPGWEHRTSKGFYYEGIRKEKGFLTPSLVGLNFNDKEKLAIWMKGSKFRIVFGGIERSEIFEEGVIVSQIPGGFTFLEKPTEIKVIVSSGP